MKRIRRPHREEIYRTEKDVAGILKVSPRTLQGWRVAGSGPPFVKLGNNGRGLVRYLDHEVRSWATKHHFDSTSGYDPDEDA